MVIADETDAAGMAKWEHYKAGTDLDAIAWRDAQAGDDPNKDPYATPNRRSLSGDPMNSDDARGAGRLLRLDRSDAR